MSAIDFPARNRAFAAYNLPPRPINNLIAFFGDSITEAAKNQSTATAIRQCNRGSAFWVPFLTRQRVISPQGLNFGVSGDTTSQMLARIGPVVASGAGTVVVLGGTNNLGSISLAQTISDLSNIYAALTGAGKIVIAVTILPKTLTASSAAQLQLWEINRWIRRQPQSYRGLYVADAASLYGDATSTTSSPIVNYSFDGLHPRALGAYFYSLPTASVVNQMFPDTGASVAGISDQFDATNAPSGNILPGLLTGTTGTVGTGTTGTVATNWSSFFSAGNGSGTPAASFSKTTDSYGLPAQQVVISGTGVTGGGAGSASKIGIAYSAGDGRVAAGNTLQAEVNVEIETGSAQISGVSALFYATVGGTTYTWEDGYPIVSDLLPSTAFNGVLRTPAAFMGATVTAWGVQIQAYLTSTSGNPAATIRFSQIALRKVV